MDPMEIFFRVLEMIFDGEASKVHPFHWMVFITVCLVILAIVIFVIWSLSLNGRIPQ